MRGHAGLLLAVAALAAGCATITERRSAARQLHLVAEEVAPALAPPLRLRWRAELPQEPVWALTRSELSRPLVVGDTVLVGSSRWPALLVLDRETGATMRQIDTEGPIQAQPLLRENELIVADVYGTVISLALPDLTERWRYQAGAAVYDTPVVHGDQLLLSTMADEVISLDASDGSWRWTHTRRGDGGGLTILGIGSPTVQGERLYAGFSDGGLVALDIRNGAELWSRQLAEGQFVDVDTRPVVRDGILYAGGFSGPLVAIGLESEAQLWQRDEGVNGQITERDGILYYSTPQGELKAVDRLTGQERWSWSSADEQLTDPTLAGHLLAVGGYKGGLYLVDAASGELVWRWRHEERLQGIHAAPVVVGDDLWVSSGGGWLYALSGVPGSVPVRDDLDMARTRHLGG